MVNSRRTLKKMDARHSQQTDRTHTDKQGQGGSRGNRTTNRHPQTSRQKAKARPRHEHERQKSGEGEGEKPRQRSQGTKKATEPKTETSERARGGRGEREGGKGGTAGRQTGPTDTHKRREHYRID